MRYISSQTERAVRFVGLSTALANARCVHLIQSQAPKSYQLLPMIYSLIDA